MSTAGKVLVVCIVLTVLVWMILAGGVAQLNRNGNQALQKLTEELEKIETDLQDARVQIAKDRDATTSIHEQIDRDLAVLRAQQADLEKSRSDLVESLTRLQYQLATVEESIKGARASLEHRTAEHKAEEKSLENRRSEVQTLKTENGQLMARLQGLRQQFQTAYHANLEMLGKK